MFLHLFDDDKFIEAAAGQFEAVCPGENRYLLGVPGVGYQLRYIKNSGSMPGLMTAAYGTPEYRGLAGDLAGYQAVFVHFLNREKAGIINAAPAKARFVWMIWGHDAYSLIPEKKYPLLDGDTTALLKRIQGLSGRSRLRDNFVHSAYVRFRRHRSDRFMHNAVRKVSYCTTVLPNEYPLFQRLLKLKAVHLPFSYGSVDDLLGEEAGGGGPGDGILLGNSGHQTNNHLAVLKMLEGCDLGGRKIITPLSYGNEGYIGEIIRAGREMHGDNFTPLTGFLPLPEYTRLISGCSVCIMNHYRQQGMGNIEAMLWLGAKVFLRECNPVHEYLKQNGLTVFSIERDLAKDKAGALAPLPEGQQRQNRRVTESLYGREAVLARTRELVRQLGSKGWA